MTQPDLFSAAQFSGAANVLPKDGDASLIPTFISPDESAALLASLQQEIPWRQERTRAYGRVIDLPRLTAWYGDPGRRYSYSGLQLDPSPWTPALSEIKTRVEREAQVSFNSVLLNLYRDGRDSVSWHSDDEPELGTNPIIASLSLGDTRRFVFRHKLEAQLRVEVALTAGSLIVMRGFTQHRWHHQVPKTSRKVGPRINLTFRAIVER